MNKTVEEIAALVGGVVVGDGGARITGLNGIREASESELTFLGNPQYKPFLDTTQAVAVLVPHDCEPGKKTVIQVSNPYQAFAMVLKEFENELIRHPYGIHPSAVVGEHVRLGDHVNLDAHTRIADGATIGNNVVLYAGVYVGRDAVIGDDTVIYPNSVVRERVIVGARCVIHNNVSLGADGFGFSAVNGRRVKIPQVGTVLIGDDVEIGANSAIDRATAGETIIGDGTKIDNLVQIGHNVRIGKHCTISGSTGIAGSAVIGDRVTIGGKVAINGHIEIGDDVVVAGWSAISHSIESGRVVSGYPPFDHAEARRILVSQRRVPDALRRIRQLEQRLQQLEDSKHNGKATDNGK